MRILLLSHRIPFPPNKGDKIRSFNILKHLAQRHEVHLATLIDDPADLPALPELSAYARSVLHARIDQPGRKLWALRAMLSRRSITVQHFYSRRLQMEIDRLVGETQFDAVLCSCSPMAEYISRSIHRSGRLAGALKVMDLIDVDSYKWRQYAERSSLVPRTVYRYEARRLEAYERQIYREFAYVLLVSEQEKRYFPATDEARKLVAIGNGVDLGYFNPDYEPVEPHTDASVPTLVFTGMMDYWPNIEGMQWFIDSVFPRIRAAVPGVRLCVVGGRPGRVVKDWSNANDIVVTGFVPDVRAYVASADVCIAPLRVARGIQNKVLEAMAMGKAVVATPEAHEGIEAEPDTDLCVAGDDTFADAVIALLRDPVRARALGANARRRMEQRYSWRANLEPLDVLLGTRVVETERVEAVRGPLVADV